MNDLQHDLRETVRAGPPGYRPPADPYALVVARVRTRVRRRRVSVVSCAAAVLAASAVAFPLLNDLDDTQVAVVAAAEPGPQGVYPEPGMPLAYLISGTQDRPVYTTTAAVDDRCLYAPDFGRTYVCFDGPTPVDWVLASSEGTVAAPQLTAFLGVSHPDVARLRVQLANGEAVDVSTVATPTTSEVRFFSAELPGTSKVAAVQTLNAQGQPLGPAFTESPPKPHRTGCGDDGRGNSWCAASAAATVSPTP